MSKTYADLLRENEKYEMGCKPENVERWKSEFNELLTALSTIHDTPHKTISRPLPVYAKSVRGNFDGHHLCPYMQFIRIDALDKADYPHNISDNSIFVTITIDLEDKTFEILKSGFIGLNKSEMKATYFAMTSMKEVVLANKGKWLRKSRFKDAKDFAKKLTKFWEEAMRIIDVQTGGYPYERLREDATPIYKVA